MTAANPRWTAARIRQATPHPKPTNALSRIEAALHAAENGDWLLKHIIEFSTIINDGRRLTGNCWLMHTGEWMLVPVTPGMVDALAQIGAATEDFECTADDEPAVDGEPSLGSLAQFSQLGWAAGDPFCVDHELDDSDHEDCGDDEPDHDAEETSWEHWAPSSTARRSARRAP